MSLRLSPQLFATLCVAVVLAAPPLRNAAAAAPADCCGKSPIQTPRQDPAAAPMSATNVFWKCRRAETPLGNGLSQYGGSVCVGGVPNGAFLQQDVSRLPLLSPSATCGASSTFCFGPFRATATGTPPDPSPVPPPVDPNASPTYPAVFAKGAPIKPKYNEGTDLLTVAVPPLFQSKLARHEVVEYTVGVGASAKVIRVELFAIDYELVFDVRAGKVDKGTYLVGREIVAGKEKLTAKAKVRPIALHAHEVLIEGETKPFVVVNHSQSPGETRFVLPEDDRDGDTGCDCRRVRLRALLRGCRR